jgi:hypothetical protein
MRDKAGGEIVEQSESGNRAENDFTRATTTRRRARMSKIKQGDSILK